MIYELFKLFSGGLIFWLIHGLTATILVCIIPITWFKKLWIIFKSAYEDDPEMVDMPSNRYLRYFYRTSRNIITNAVARTIIYLATILFLTTCSLALLVSKIF